MSLYQRLFCSFLIIFLPVYIYPTFVPKPSSSAGIVEREVAREYSAPLFPIDKYIPNIELETPAEQLNLPDGTATVMINSVFCNGYNVFEQDVLDETIAPFLNRDLSMCDIREICLTIQELYVQNGYFLARAYPPPQRIENGILCIEILEGVLGKVTVEGNCYYPANFIAGYLSPLICQPINYDQIIKALILLNENENLSVTAAFVKGEEVGTADLVLRVEDARPVHYYANTNNYGSHATSRWRAGGRIDYGNLFQPGDMLSVAGVVGFPFKLLKFVDLFYSLPINKKGDFLEVGYLNSRSRVNELHELHLNGSSEIASVGYRHALQRKRTYSTDLFITFQCKQIFNYALHHLNSRDKLRVVTFGVDFDRIDCFNGHTIGDIRASAGLPNFLNGSNPIDHKSSRKGAGGRFFTLNTDIQRLQVLPWNCLLLTTFSAQLSANKLTLPEQFYIGGADTVRGYPLAAALGDDGYVFNAEFRIPPFFFADKLFPFMQKTCGEVLQFVAFLDNGGVYLKNGKTEGQKSSVFLTSVGVGVRLFGPYGFEISCDVGFPLTKRERKSNATGYFRVVWDYY